MLNFSNVNNRYDKVLRNNPCIKAFVDTTGTTYYVGPYIIDGKTYDFKIVDSDGVDYCTEEQLNIWNVVVAQVLTC